MNSRSTLLCLVATFLCSLSQIVQAESQDTDWVEDSNGCKVANPHPHPIETIKWSGRCKDGYIEGAGTVQWYSEGKVNCVSSGTFKGGKLSGKGYVTMPYADYKRVNVGKRDFNFHRIWPSGSRLDGVFVEDQLVGDGIMTKPNGQKVVVNQIDGRLVRKAEVNDPETKGEIAPRR